MADAKKCDRCGSYFAPYIAKPGYKNLTRYRYVNIVSCDYPNECNKTGKQYDLCRKCSSELSQFMEAGDNDLEIDEY